MRRELQPTYLPRESDGGLYVFSRNPQMQLVEFGVGSEVLSFPFEGREIRLQPVTPKVSILAATPEMERVMAAAAKGCYSSLSAAEIFLKIDREQAEKFLREKILPTGHFSVVEHGYITFSIENVSRALTHQLVRHRIADYSQQSQRYTNPLAEKIEHPTFRFIVPPSYRYDRAAFTDYVMGIKEPLINYLQAIRQNKKEEDARMFLPNAAATNIVMTVNCRALWEIATKRTCALAQWEIDMVLTRMVLEAYKHAPVVFENAGPECARTKCREGNRSCGIPIKPLVIYKDEKEYPHDSKIFGMK